MPKRAWPPMIDRVILRDGYAETLGSQLRRHQPTTGVALLRRLPAKRPDTMTATLFFQTYADYSAFREWFECVEDGLAGGIYTVAWQHPLNNKSMSVRLLPQSEEAAWTAAPYKETAFAWAVPVTLEVMP